MIQMGILERDQADDEGGAWARLDVELADGVVNPNTFRRILPDLRQLHDARVESDRYVPVDVDPDNGPETPEPTDPSTPTPAVLAGAKKGGKS